MILELATFTITTTRLAEFEAAFIEARQVIARADGCGAVSLYRCLETPGRYQLLVEWTSVAHHMQGFRESPGFVEWRRLLGPFFAAAPVVEHYAMAGVS